MNSIQLRNKAIFLSNIIMNAGNNYGELSKGSKEYEESRSDLVRITIDIFEDQLEANPKGIDYGTDEEEAEETQSEQT